MIHHGQKLTDLEIDLLKALALDAGNDCTVNFGPELPEDGSGVYGWFGFFDKDFTDAAVKINPKLKGKTLSGVAASLAKKELISCYEEESYYTGRDDKKGWPITKKMNAWQIRNDTVKVFMELAKGKKVDDCSLTVDNSNDVLHRGTKAECQMIKDAMVRYGIREDKLIIVEV